jgi:hypothetical protein
MRRASADSEYYAGSGGFGGGINYASGGGVNYASGGGSYLASLLARTLGRKTSPA